MLPILLLALAAIARADDYDSTVVISAPLSDDAYYKAIYNEVIRFHASFANKLKEAGVNFVINCDAKTCKRLRYEHGIKNEHLWRAFIPGVWFRDLSRAGRTTQVGYKYKPAYIKSHKDAKEMQDTFDKELKKAGVKFDDRNSLVIDAGNVVDNFKDKAILTSRVLQENMDNPAGIKLANGYPNYSDKERNAMEELLGKQLGKGKPYRACIIPEIEGDTTGHSDGMLSFINEFTVAYSVFERNNYTCQKGDDPSWCKPFTPDIHGKEAAVSMLQNLRRCFPDKDVAYVPVPYVYPGKARGTAMDSGFTSACGTHVNALFTGDKLFIPTFSEDKANRKDKLTKAVDNAGAGAMERKADYVKTYRVPVPKVVCSLGGNVRCLSYLLDGENGAKLLAYVRKEAKCWKEHNDEYGCE